MWKLLVVSIQAYIYDISPWFEYSCNDVVTQAEQEDAQGCFKALIGFLLHWDKKGSPPFCNFPPKLNCAKRLTDKVP